jgi:stage III sporulation protein AB
MASGGYGFMTIKWIGAILIISACGGFGVVMAANHRREMMVLKQLISALDYMECELQFRMCPLPELCRLTAAESSGVVSKVFSTLAGELEDQISPDASQCMHSSLIGMKNIPDLAMECFQYLGECLGKFDLPGQLRGLEAVRQECRAKLNKLMQNSDSRIRNYQTVGLCAGAAIVILLI